MRQKIIILQNFFHFYAKKYSVCLIFGETDRFEFDSRATFLSFNLCFLESDYREPYKHRDKYHVVKDSQPYIYLPEAWECHKASVMETA